MLNKLLLVTFFAFLNTVLFAQKAPIFSADLNAEKTEQTVLSQFFTDYQTFSIDLTEMNELVVKEKGNTEFRLKIGDTYDWSFDLRSSEVVNPETYSVSTSAGTKSSKMPAAVPAQGYINGVQADLTALTVGADFLYGFVEQGGQTFYIEPLNYFIADAANDAFIIYEAADVIKDNNNKCAAIELDTQKKKQAPQKGEGDEKMVVGECYTVQLAIASDYSMYQKYGSVSGVESHNVGVMNNVATDYDDAFADEIQFDIVEQYIVTTSGGNPWTSSTSASALLSSFRSWAPSGFSNTHDLGMLWTNRNFDGSTVGIAYVGAVCSNYRYQCLQDFSSTAWSLRVLVSHETGHNFNCPHDASGSPHIMAPAVNNTTSWSTNSINTVNSYVNTISCLASGCSGGGGGGGGGGGSVPVAEFSGTPTSGCAPLVVDFTNLSTGATSVLWNFSGTTTTISNPTVTYNQPGVYSVTLTATNASGSDTETKTNYINVGSGNTNVAFSYSINGNTVSFNNNSSGASSYFWSFGDGTTSSQTNPVHTYAGSGTYVVTLTAAGDCGNESTSQTVFIQNSAPPVANFTANQTSGCTPFTVNYQSTSTGNPTSYQWSFPGGTPAASSLPNPVITYDQPGEYDTYLTVFNSFGQSTEVKTDFITVVESPTIAFTTNQNGNTVNFINTSEGASSYFWSFGDGTTSNQTNPTHTYSNFGTYTVTLTGFSSCGQSAFTSVVTVNNTPPPNAAFTVFSTQGCAPHTTQFLDQSTGSISSYSWSFPGANPSTAISANPTVTFPQPGTYTVSLTVSNGGGSDTETKVDYITVFGAPELDYSYNQNGSYVSIDNDTDGDYSYVWDFGDGYTTIFPSPSHTYTTPGTYTVSVTATGACGTVTDSFTVTIAAPPTADFTATQSEGCAPFTVVYTNNSTGSGNTYQWSFPGGSPAFSTQVNPTVTYSTPGVYNATLTATNNLGTDTEVKNNFMNVGGEPNAGFSYDIDGTTVEFDYNGTFADGFSWNFGDGTSSAQMNPTHTYAQAGTYFVSLTANNDCGSDVITQVVVIVTAPTADFTANQTEGCAAFTVAYSSAPSEGAASYIWNFPGGIPSFSTAPNPLVTYAQPGTYNATLTVSNAAGSDTETKVNYITAGTTPTADFALTTTGFTTVFTNTSSNATTYAWNFGDGTTSNQSNPTHTFSANGTYTVTLTASNDCGTATTSETVTIFVETVPTAGFTATTTDGCAPFTVTFNNSSSANADSFAWTFEGGTPATSTAQNPTVTFNNAGTFDVSLIVTNEAGSDTETKTDYITAGAAPAAGFTYVINGNTVVFSNTSTAANDFNWNFGNGATSNAANPTYTFDENGTYTVTLTANNDCGTDTASETFTIFVESVPTAGFTATETDGCAPFTVTFNNSSSSNSDSYAWTFEGGTPATSTAENPTVTFNNVGTFDVSLTVTNEAGSDTETKVNYITVGTTPTADFTFTTTDFTTVFNNSSSNATSYTWSFGDGTTSNQSNPTHTFSANGTYVVTLSASNDCGTVTTSETVMIFVESAPVAAFSAAETEGCAPFTVTFNNTSSANADSFAWTFEGGTPATSNLASPTVTFNNAGTFDVSLTVTNEAGSDTETKADYITVGAMPTAGFTYVANGNTVVFSNTSTAADTYSWNFGNGATSSAASPTYTFDENGTYTVTLTASNDCGTDNTSETFTIFVESVPTAGFTAETTDGCAPFTVTFNNSSSSNADSFAWTFEGGTPAVSTEENPTVTFDNAGTFDVTLTVENEAGSDTFTQTDFISVNDAPTAGFDFAVSDFTVTFENTSNNATSYTWNFGDDNTSTEDNPTHTFAADGIYEVTLTATNECGENSTTETVTIDVQTAPTADFSTEQTEVCVNQPLQMQNLSSDNAETFLWTAEGATPATSTDQIPYFTYTEPGVYTITLTATNAAGTDTETKVDYITVGEAPVADFNYNQIDNGVYAVSNSTGATSLTWDFGDGTIVTDQENPAHTYTQDGTYTLTLTAVNDCGTDVVSTEITVLTVGPISDFTADATEGCAPFTVNFENLSENNPTNYYWIFEGANIESSFLENPTVTYEEAGTYSVVLVAYNSNGIDSTEYVNYITVNNYPEAQFESEMNGQLVSFTNTSLYGDSYLWNFGDGTTSTEENPTHLYPEAGLYEVSLEVTNECGMRQAKLMLTIETIEPTALFTADTQEGCADLTVFFTNESLGNPTSYLWTFEGGNPATSTEAEPMVTYENGGNFTVTLEVTNDAGSNTTTYVDYISVTEAPTAAFTYEADALEISFAGQDGGNATYAWDFGDGNTATLENPTHTYADAGTYTVTLFVTNDCGTAEYATEVTINLSSIDGIDFVDVFEVYPNPNAGQFTLRLEGDRYASQNLTVSFTNIVGQLIERENIDFNGNLQKSYDFKDLPAGMYLLQINAGKNRMFKKIVIEK